ncbi:MAG: hypothetical protein ACFFBD_25630 [Candidatus Hodarchaeota archaeon]
MSKWRWKERQNHHKKIDNLVKDWGFEEGSKTKIKFYVIPYGDVLSSFQTSRIAEDYICIFCKRCMLGIAEKIAIKEKVQAVMTGDNLAQVASQTAWNLVSLNQSVTLPIYRPLIAFNKQEIVKLARQIGTFSDHILL